MEDHVAELRQKQKKLTFLLGDKVRRLYKSQAVRFLYTSDGVEDEEDINKLIRLLEYLNDRIRKLEEIYGPAEDADGAEGDEELTQDQQEEYPEAEGQEEDEADAGDDEVQEEPTAQENEQTASNLSEEVPRAQRRDAVDDQQEDSGHFFESVFRTAAFNSDAEKRLCKDNLDKFQKGTEREREVAIGHIAHSADYNTLRKIYAFVMQHESSVIRRAVIRQVCRMPDAHYDELLVRGLQDTDIQVRIAALKGIGTQPSPQHGELLEQSLKDADEHIRGLAVTYLGIYFGKEGALQAYTAMSDPSPYVRKSLIEMLAIVKPEGAMAAIKDLLSDKDVVVVKAAEEALAKLVPEHMRRPRHGKGKK